MMKKTRSNAKWIGLSVAQRKTLETWLFEERVNYEEALRRAQSELGFQGSVSSVKRFYARRSQERLLESMAEERTDAQEIADDAASAALFRTAGMKLAARLFFQQVREMPGNVKEWSALAKLMLWSEDIELRRTLKTEENQLRRDRMAFAKERFQFNTVEKALKILPQLQELAEARKDPKQREYEEGKRVNAIIRNLFGSHMPKSHPENAEEEAAMEEAARREQEEHDRRAEAVRRRAREEAAARARRATEGRQTSIPREDATEEGAELNVDGEEGNQAQQSRTTTSARTITIGAPGAESPAPNIESGTQEIRNEPEERGRDFQEAKDSGGPDPANLECGGATGGPRCTTDEEWARRNRAA